MFNPWAIFAVFTVLATFGVTWAVKAHKGTKAAVFAALASLLFFAGLATYVVLIVRWGTAE